MASTSPDTPQRRSLRLLAWATLPVTLIALTVSVTGRGIDILVVAMACLILLALERTLGDWLGELMGSGPAALVFVLCISGGIWYFVGDKGGRAQTDSFFAAAEKRGYSTVYYSPSPPADGGGEPDAASAPSSAPSERAPRTAATSGRPATGTGGGASNADRAGSEPEPTPEADQKREGTTQSSGALKLLGLDRPARQTPTNVTLRLTPPQVPIARRTTLTAAVSSGGRPVTVGTVVFTVNGSPAGQAVIDAGGVATSTWSTYLAGAHEVRARYLGAGPYAASVSDAATLTVR